MKRVVPQYRAGQRRGCPGAFVGGVISLGLLSASCCKISSGQSSKPADPVVNIGDISLPPSYSGPASNHDWMATRLKPNHYKLGYALIPSEIAALDDEFTKYAGLVKYRKTANGYTWVPPKDCQGVGMQCVYEALARRSWPDMQSIVEKFRERGAVGHLSTLELANLVVTFVQNITYEVPAKPFGVMPPALVISERRGDCDSKSLVGHMILSALGIQTVMLSSPAHKHAMLGIALPSTGTTKSYRGRDYAFTEMTAKGSPIGYINPKKLSPDDWRVIPTRLPVGGP